MAPTASWEVGCQCCPNRFLCCSVFVKYWGGQGSEVQQRAKPWWRRAEDTKKDPATPDPEKPGTKGQRISQWLARGLANLQPATANDDVPPEPQQAAACSASAAANDNVPPDPDPKADWLVA